MKLFGLVRPGAMVLAAATLSFSGAARAEITVLMSGGFSLAYQQLLPEFQQTTGIKVVTTSGASQGTGPTTIKAQLERGAHADVVILSREGLEELMAASRIVAGTDVGLATSPLGAAVRTGSPKPDVSTVPALTQTLLNARLITMPGSTSGIFIRDKVFPQLGVADKVSVKITPRGIDSTKMLGAGESDLALGPVSELVQQPNVEYVAALPNEVQLVQEFTAAIVKGSKQTEEAQRLLAFLTESSSASAIRTAGMEPVAKK